jgi:hypothetical protein
MTEYSTTSEPAAAANAGRLLMGGIVGCKGGGGSGSGGGGAGVSSQGGGGGMGRKDTIMRQKYRERGKTCFLSNSIEINAIEISIYNLAYDQTIFLVQGAFKITIRFALL